MSETYKIEIIWKDKDGNTSFQNKSFSDRDKALEWCKKNGRHIVSINGSGFYGGTLADQEIRAAMRNREGD